MRGRVNGFLEMNTWAERQIQGVVDESVDAWINEQITQLV
jgi:hypothetical protein